MPFIEETDKYQKWKYTISEFYILYPDGRTTEVPTQRVQSISITHLYEQNLFPVFRVELTLAGITYYEILKYKDKVKFKLRIQKYFTAIDSTEKSLTRDWINDTFDLILDDDNFNTEENILKEEKELSYENIIDTKLENDMFQVDNLIEFFLFKSDLVEKLNMDVNAIIKDGTVNDAIQYIATQSGIDNILMTQPHNNTSYKELYIPPLKAKNAIKFLDTYYGLYKTGMLFYGDMVDNILYIINYSSECSAFQKNELKETNILIPKKSSKHASDLCALYRRGNTEKYFIIGSSDHITIRNETVSFNAYSSTDANVIDPYDGSVSSVSTDVKVKNTKSVKVIENHTENQWFKNIYKTLIDSKNIVMELILADYDISAITPNKLYKIVFEDSILSSKYKKNVLLTEATHTLAKEGNDFILSSVLKFKQI